MEREVLYDTRGLTKVASISITRRRICMWTKPDYEIRVISSEDFWWGQVGTCVTRISMRLPGECVCATGPQIPLLLFSSCIRNTVTIKVPEGMSELFEISKI